MGIFWMVLRLLAAFNMLTKPTRTVGRRAGYRAVRRIFR